MRPLRTAFLLWAWTPGARTLSRLRERKCAGARTRLRERKRRAPSPRQLMVSSGRFLGRGPGFSAL